MPLFRKKENTAAPVDFDRLPRHIAIIMDGNGRWAKRRGLPRTAGHAAGAETFRTIATYCKDIGLEYLTVYAFSTENWKRPAEEVSAIMGLLRKYLLEAIGRMEKDRVKMRFFGDLSPLNEELRTLCRETEAISDRYEGCQVNICLNYGGRDELLRAARAFAGDCAAGRGDPTICLRRNFHGICFPPACRTQTLSSGPAASCAFPIFCCGSRPTRSSILPTCSGRTSAKTSCTKRWRPIKGGRADLEGSDAWVSGSW